MGWTFPWSVTAVRGTHYCLRKIDYPEIWRLLKEEGITHMNSAPTVNTLLCNDPGAERLDIPVRVTVAASPPSAHLFKTMENLNLQPVHVSRMGVLDCPRYSRAVIRLQGQTEKSKAYLLSVNITDCAF